MYLKLLYRLLCGHCLLYPVRDLSFFYRYRLSDTDANN